MNVPGPPQSLAESDAEQDLSNNPFSRDATPAARIRFYKSMLAAHEHLRRFWELEEFSPFASDASKRSARNRLRTIDADIARLGREILRLHKAIILHDERAGVASALAKAATEPAPPRCPSCGGVVIEDIYGATVNGGFVCPHDDCRRYGIFRTEVFR